MQVAIGPRALLRKPGYRRLWLAGGLANAMRWLEILAAGIYTFEATRSALLVAVVTVARSLPLLVMGALSGVLGEALNRKTLLLDGLVVMAANSAALGALAASGLIRIWHIALAGIVAGTFYSSEMAVRRRMIGEIVEAPAVGPAVALDSATGSLTRMVGPLIGGALFQGVGLAGCYVLAAALYAAAAIIVAGLAFRQETRRLNLSRIPADILEGLATARREKLILGVVLVTIVTNVFGFSYTALLAPLGIATYGATPFLVGLLAAAEPLGAITSGLAMAAGWVRMDRPRMMIGGSFAFLAALALVALAPWYALAFALLLAGGLGTAAFSSMQSTLVLTAAPPQLRSRVMGIITMCIGTGPLGVLAVGSLSDRLGPSSAMLIMALAGIAALAPAARLWPRG